MSILDGKKSAEKILLEVKTEISELKGKLNRVPGLSVIIVGEDPASKIYVRTKDKKARKVGLYSEIIRYAASVSEKELKGKIISLNNNPLIDGILVQLPLPKKFNSWSVLDVINPAKDVDGFHPENLGMLMLGRREIFPCTPFGVLRILDDYKIDVTGMNCVVIGRSLIVGKPMAAMLTNRNATVTICHSKTRNIEDIISRADLIVAAVGHPGFVKAGMVKKDAILIDVGMNYLDKESDVLKYCSEEQKDKFYKKGYGITGDIHPEAFEKAKYFTPVPGGVGPMTVAMLMYNTFHLFKKNNDLI